MKKKNKDDKEVKGLKFSCIKGLKPVFKLANLRIEASHEAMIEFGEGLTEKVGLPQSCLFIGKGGEMKTAKQMKKEAREGFDEKGKAPYWFYLLYEQVVATDMLEECWEWIDQLIDTTIKQTLEGVRVEEKSVLEMFCYQGPPTKRWLETEGEYWNGFNQAVKQQTKLAKEIEGKLK